MSKSDDRKADAGLEAREQLTTAMAGSVLPGRHINYGDTVLVRSELAPELFDLYSTSKGEEGSAEWVDLINVNGFRSVGELEQYLRQYVGDLDAEPGDVKPVEGRGFQ